VRERLLYRWTTPDGNRQSFSRASHHTFRTIVFYGHRTSAAVRVVCGRALILIAYTGHQLRWIDARSAGSNILNAIGSAILGYIACYPFQIGFVVLKADSD